MATESTALAAIRAEIAKHEAAVRALRNAERALLEWRDDGREGVSAPAPAPKNTTLTDLVRDAVTAIGPAATADIFAWVSARKQSAVGRPALRSLLSLGKKKGDYERTDAGRWTLKRKAPDSGSGA